MLANELRIGNWIEAVATMGNYQMQMTEHNFESLAKNPNCANPIKLSEEIMIKLGFEKGVKTFGLQNWYIKHCGFVLSNNKNDSETPDLWYLKSDIDKQSYIFSITYLHEFQNIYYYFSKTELTYRP